EPCERLRREWAETESVSRLPRCARKPYAEGLEFGRILENSCRIDDRQENALRPTSLLKRSSHG
ncbi:MAG: hypothetical protein WCJ91_08575, partial [Actinomycetes bacterium]